MSDTSPTTSITVCNNTNEEACRTSGNELGYMFFHNLTGSFPKTGDQGPFTNIPEGLWSGTEYSANGRGPSTPALAASSSALRKARTTVGRFAPDNVEPRPAAHRRSQR